MTKMVNDSNTVQENPRVTVRFAQAPCYYHLIEVQHRSQSVCIQIKSECDKKVVAELAAHIGGLGVI